MPSGFGEEQVKVIARVAIDTLPRDVKAYELLLDRTTSSFERAVDLLERLESPLRFCFYCCGVSALLFGAARLVRVVRSPGK